MNNISFEDIIIKVPELRIWFQDKEIRPSLQDLRLLLILLSEPYRKFSTNELINLIDLPSKPALQTLVCRVRRMLGGKYIIAVPGYGYTFARERNQELR